MSEDKITLDNENNEDKNNADKNNVNKNSADINNDGKKSTDGNSTDGNSTDTNTADINYSEEITQKEESVDNADVNPSGDIEDVKPADSEPIEPKKKKKLEILKLIRIFCLISFIIFTFLFINEAFIQPYRIKKTIAMTRDLYNKPTSAPTAVVSPTQPPVSEITPSPAAVTATPTPDPNKDALGRLLEFKDLLAQNEDTIGWLSIPDTNVDYVVMQSGVDDPDYYLHKDFNKKYSKAGTLYLDYKASVKNNSQNFVIYGHNMVSTTEKMFHYVLNYKKLKYYKEHPLINFDTIYNKGVWKVFAVFITTPDIKKDYFFEYRRSSFKDSSDFLNFVYQIRIRSMLNIDSVDINENDQLLMLSTCSYEVNQNYRTVVVARKVRDGEDPDVDVDSATTNENPLYADDYYKRFGGKAPDLADTFEEALKNGDINWYAPAEKSAEE
jgi:sortase B